MLILKILLIAIETICSLLLIVVILLQKSKGQGLGLAFGTEMGESIFGAHASNALVKITAWLGVIFVLNTIIMATIYSNAPSRSLVSDRARPAAEQPALPPAGGTLPAVPSMPSQPGSMPGQGEVMPALPPAPVSSMPIPVAPAQDAPPLQTTPAPAAP